MENTHKKLNIEKQMYFRWAKSIPPIFPFPDQRGKDDSFYRF